jgi:ubiquinone/menaquinone biosynthesis C-methylase UbiE
VQLSADEAHGPGTPDNRALHIPLVLEPWLRELIADPISKKKFIRQDSEGFMAPCGFLFHFKGGVPDFRVHLGTSQAAWATAQRQFVEWVKRYLDRGETTREFYRVEQERDKRVYEEIPLEGSVLDVGGQLGQVRKYMAADQHYCAVDPFLDVLGMADNRESLFANYPLHLPLNFLAGFAEFLPISDQSFDTVNMRSCIDHFANPTMAIMEAFRVTKKGGKLIVGLKIEGHTVKSKLLSLAKGAVGALVVRYRDHHIWHPSYAKLMGMCRNCGFELDKEYWQTDDILYACFVRQDSQLISVQS